MKKQTAADKALGYYYTAAKIRPANREQRKKIGELKDAIGTAYFEAVKAGGDTELAHEFAAVAGDLLTLAEAKAKA